MNRFGTLHWEIHERVGHLVLNQPPANPMNDRFFRELRDLVKNGIRKEEAGALLIYGVGRHFSSGAYLEDLFWNVLNFPDHSEPCSDPDLPVFLKENLESFRFFRELDIPVISLIRGVCLGAGLELALFSDVRICSGGALLGLPETTFNLIPGLGGIQNMLVLTSPLKTLEIVLGGSGFTAEEALEWNIVHKVVEKKIAMDYAVRFAQSLAESDYRTLDMEEHIAAFDRQYFR